MKKDIKLSTLVAQARGGRVVRTPFMALSEIDRKLLEDVHYKIEGGFSDAGRVMLTLFPEHIPDVDSGVQVLKLSTENAELDSGEITVILKTEYGAEGSFGEIREHKGDWLIVCNEKLANALLSTEKLGTHECHIELHETAGGHKVREVVVPSMRVDVVGAKGFGVSRAYFQQGIDGGKVRLNGQPVRSSTEIREGDSLSAEGLGRVDFRRVVNETRRGNFKVELDVHK